MFNISEEDKRTDLMVPEGYKWPDKAKSREPSVDDEASVLEARRLADEDELFKKKIHAIKSKGKKWTLTPDGAILEIVPPGKAESALSPPYAVRGVQRQPLAPSPAKSPPPKHSTKKKKGRDSEAKAPSAADARRDAAEAAFRRYFKVSPLEQPSMVAGEGGFGCAAGVTVKQGARSLAGAPMLEDPDHRSRASYAVWKSNLQPDFNVRVFECFDTSTSAALTSAPEALNQVCPQVCPPPVWKVLRMIRRSTMALRSRER